MAAGHFATAVVVRSAVRHARPPVINGTAFAFDALVEAGIRSGSVAEYFQSGLMIFILYHGTRRAPRAGRQVYASGIRSRHTAPLELSRHISLRYYAYSADYHALELHVCGLRHCQAFVWRPQ